MKNSAFLLSFFLVLRLTVGHSQCTINVNNGGFEYNVAVDLDITDVIYTQNGSTCNVNIEVTYDIQIDVITQPGWWNGVMYTLQGNFNCVGGSGSSFFQLQNNGGAGSDLSATFSFSGVDCEDVILDCPITLQIQGPGGLNYTGPCGSFESGTLPVVLTEFDYLNDDKGVKVFWSTASEINFSHFELQSSTDLTNWDRIEIVKGSEKQLGSDYLLQIPSSLQDRYMRLKMIDYDGQYSYSRMLSISSQSDKISIYPNPTSEILYIAGSKTDRVEILNNMGQLTAAYRISDNTVDVSALDAGSYIIRIYTMKGMQVERFLKY